MSDFPARPRVHVIGLGGTIASIPSTGGDAVAPQLSAEDLVLAVPQIARYADITAEQLAQVGSASLDLTHISEVARRAAAEIGEGAAGVVVTQGTDTLEESAYLLSLLNPADRPIIVTGAMRNPSLPGADGPANILGAVLAARDRQLAAIPAAAVFNDEIHDPMFVRKSHVSSTATFTSGPAYGPLGWIVEDVVHLAHSPTTRLQLGRPATFGSVALVPAGLGDDLRLLDALPDLGYQGVVIDGVGGGHVHASAVDRVATLAAQLPVVLASRTGSGQMLRSTYGYPGSETDLLSRGLLNAGPLSGRKARLLLATLIGLDRVADWPY